MDDNGDGFMDLPKTRLGAVANRWLYTADNGAQVRWGFKYLAENRLSGQKHYKASMREEMDTDWDKGGHVRLADQEPRAERLLQIRYAGRSRCL